VTAPTRGGKQQIPRPAGARAGGPPPWASLAEAQRRGIGVARVRRGFEARGWLGTTPRAVPPARLARYQEPAARPAAVLCALFEEAGEAHVILTRRSSNLRSHTGEVSFPGGRLEIDEAAVAGALREASEEVGIDPAAIEILGPLSPLVTVRNLVLISPFVGVLPERPILLPSPAEVERAFDVSLAELVSEGVYREELWHLPDVAGAGEEWRSISFFELPGDTVWGATAWMLRDLLEVTLSPA
jgi:8-oxo-dGTP pyrophosphatase MutT (NUDIX family)